LAELESVLSNLLLTYTNDYPDVVSVKQQIEDIKQKIRDSEGNKLALPVSGSAPSGEALVLNPLYQEIRSRLSQAQINVQAREKRMIALQELLDKEFDRRKRIAERAAEEAELLRDYDVTRRIYEDMLERKERARLSMTLNIEGQGVTYRIQEPPIPPIAPIGLRFAHFVVLGPIVGFLFVIGLLVAYVLVDRSIRFPETLSRLNVPLLAVVPHVMTPFTKRVRRIDMVVYIFLCLLVMAAYIGLALVSKLGYVGI
jgi:uncharacterized protein involved in exopolysaccharide biosynthesis